jgi:enterochelin esterase-like enzyme
MGQLVDGEVPSRITGTNTPYRVYLPPCYGDDGLAYPLLFLFHGSIHDETQWDRLGVDEAADAGIASGLLPPMIIVLPAGGSLANSTSGGPWSFEGVVVDELLPAIESEYCVWNAREGRAIGGLSRGGYWALEIALRRPTLFASVGGHSAALLDLVHDPSFSPEFTAFSNDLAGLRILLDIGTEDYLRTNTIAFHEALASGGIAHEWWNGPGQHDDAYWSGNLTRYLAWYADPWPLERQVYPPCT